MHCRPAIFTFLENERSGWNEKAKEKSQFAN
jgi:hypothetical protein